ncbi:MAG: tetraacyldisaccharide 4'-kinase [Bacteroidales bacterium]|nr:tetraacyldisaccharide 4'-kinase [Bacteroidales bacterium]
MLCRKNILCKLLLIPFALGYRFIVSMRNFFYDNGIFSSKEFQIPVIAVGNIMVGGTGKTPHTEMIAEMLRKQFKIAVLSRGYKRKSKGYLEVQPDTSYTQSGDEPLQIKRKFPDVVVSVCENRVKGIYRLMDEYPDLNAVILDDAFQHRRVKPGISVLLNTYHHPLSKDHLLPYGRMREGHSASLRADIIIVTKCPEKMNPMERRIMLKEIDPKPYQTLFFSTFQYHSPSPVFENLAGSLSGSLSEYNVLVITGIAFSANLIDYLHEQCQTIEHLRFADHHSFSKADMQKAAQLFDKMPENKIILTTEKDSIRLFENKYLSDDLKKAMYYLPITVKMMGGNDDVQQLEKHFITYVSTNKRYSKLYKNTGLNHA